MELTTAPAPAAPADSAAPCHILLKGEEEHAAWNLAPPAARRAVLDWDKDMRAMLDSTGGLRGKLAQRIATRRGLSLSAVNQKFYAWQKGGWMALLNKAKVKPSATLPPTFVEFWKALIGGHQRRKTTVKQAFRTLTARLEAWERDHGLPDSPHAIPGYLMPPRRQQTTRLPAGWSYDTLNKLKPGEHERVLRSIGPKAYSRYLPPVRASRVGMRVGELYFFDDEQPDVYVNFTGTNRRAMRPLGFHCLDFVSGANVRAGFRPQILGDDNRVKSLTLQLFEWFTVDVLMQCGWHPEGTTFVGEMGTAKHTDAFSERLAIVTEGKVDTKHSGRFGDPAFRGMLYEGATTGNFRHKAPLESWFNLLRNNMAALPGPTGRNRDEAPEETPGLMRANKWFLQQLEELGQDRRSMLMSPILEWSQFDSFAHHMIGRMNARTEHHILDYEKLGFTVPVLDLDGREFPLHPEVLANMDEAQRLKLELLTATGHSRIRRLSPAEVLRRHTPDLRRLRGWHVPTLMGEEAARVITVSKDFSLRVSDQDTGADELIYIAAAMDQNNRQISLTRGEAYLCYLNPYSANTMQVCEAGGSRHGAWIGEVALNPAYTRTDQHGAWKQHTANMTATAAERADIERRSMAEIHRRTADWSWNKRVADTSTPLTPNEKRGAAKREEAEDAMAAAASAPAPAAPATAPRNRKLVPDLFD